MREFTEQELVRREKAEKIKSMGLDPFGERFDRTGYAKEINEKYKDIPHDDFENIKVNMLGNIADLDTGLQKSINKIIDMVKIVLEQTPPELSADIIEKGIVLTGGGALLKNLPELMQEKLNVPVYIANEPLVCVAEGTGIILNNLHYIV